MNAQRAVDLLTAEKENKKALGNIKSASSQVKPIFDNCQIIFVQRQFKEPNNFGETQLE